MPSVRFRPVSKRGLFQEFQQTVAAGRLWKGGEKLLAGVSGGPDSVALLHLMLAVGCRPVVAHVNHGLRGAQSDRDERFVHDLCRRWGCDFEAARVPTEAEARRSGRSIEETARMQRYRFFGELCRERGFRKVAVAHTRNDQAETLLLRLLRGSGGRGLGGMKIISPLPEAGGRALLVRPLLRISRDSIEAYLKQNRLRHRIDRSNRRDDFLRNRIRLKLIPTLARGYQPAIVEVLARTAENLADEDRVVEALAARFAVPAGVSARRLARLPEGLRARGLLAWIESRTETTPSRERLEAVLRLAASGGAAAGKTVQLGGGWSVAVHGDRLGLTRRR